jgi:hypothetical protein
MIESFEDWRPPVEGSVPTATGSIDLDIPAPINQIITVDGGHQAVPNVARPARQVGFVQVAAQMVKMETIQYLRDHPMADPRDVRQSLGQYTHHTLAALPLTGVRIPGQSVRESIREAIHRFLAHYELYEALSFLVYRRWEAEIEEPPFMDCLTCAESFDLPRNALNFRCPSCNTEHRLSDYLGLVDQEAEDRSRVETVSNLRAVLEALVLFSFIVRFRERRLIMDHTLFLLDGPLLLRAQLSRLVEPIRALIAHQRDNGCSVYLVGIEKSGEFRSFADECSTALMNPGDFFLPDTRFVIEEINGRVFKEETYRNRVNYGSKVVVRIGTDHVLALNVPTGPFVLSPKSKDLIGFEEIVRALSHLPSYAHENALIPIVMANTEASISNRPSGGILAQFVDRILRGVS